MSHDKKKFYWTIHRLTTWEWLMSVTKNGVAIDMTDPARIITWRFREYGSKVVTFIRNTSNPDHGTWENRSNGIFRWWFLTDISPDGQTDEIKFQCDVIYTDTSVTPKEERCLGTGDVTLEPLRLGPTT